MDRARELPERARVLIVRLSALGDILFSLETVASLATERPDVRIDFMVEDRFAGILRGHPQIERLIVYPRKHKGRMFAFARELRSVRYDAILDLHGILKSAIPIGLVARADRKLGFMPPAAREGAHRLYWERVALESPLPHRAERGYALLRALGLRAARAQPELPPPPDAAGSNYWTGDDRPRVVLHPGASAFAAFKRWPAPKHAELARRLLSAGYDVAISFGPGERELADLVVELASDHAYTACRLLDGGELGLLGLAEAMRRADVVVAADTGPLHIATAAGAKVVALFGPKDPDLYGPRGDGHETLFHHVPCRPCKRRTCATPQCILGLEVDDVEAAVQRVVTSARMTV